jgi:protein-disulfide isomerase
MLLIRPAAALCTALLLAGPAAAFDPTQMTEAERAAFRAEVRAYLMENPEVLMEVIGVLEQRQAEAEAASDIALVQSHAAEIFNDPASWVGGNPEGDITVVEFVDYRCGYCRKAHDEVAELVRSDGNIRLVLKEFPILGEESLLSSKFAIAVLQTAGPEAYARAHEALITLRGNATPEAMTRIAGDLGLDPAPLLARMESPEVLAVIQNNHALAEKLKISGTPTFVVDSAMVRGYVPLDGMRAIVAQERQG